jgi:hypothetical protein
MRLRGVPSGWLASLPEAARNDLAGALVPKARTLLYDWPFGARPTQLRYPDAWDMLMFGLRLSTDPRVVVNMTPRPTKVIRELIADPMAVVRRGSTYGTVPTWRPPCSIKSSPNTRGHALAARRSRPSP